MTTEQAESLFMHLIGKYKYALREIKSAGTKGWTSDRYQRHSDLAQVYRDMALVVGVMIGMTKERAQELTESAQEVYYI